MGGAIRVLVVDDHAAVRMGLGGLLEAHADVEVVSTTASAREALDEMARVAPDVAVVDYHLGGDDGLSLCRSIKRLPRPPRVLIYSAYAGDALAAAALVAGADGVLSKGSLGDDVVHTIRALMHGRRVMPPVRRSAKRALRARLEPRDQAIFGMLIQGIPLAEAAEALGLEEPALEGRRTAIIETLMEVDAPAPALEPAGAWS